MRRHFTCLVILVSLGCAHSHAFFPSVELGNDVQDENPGAPISGEDCVPVMFGSPLGSVNTRVAIEHAMSSSPANRISDVHVSEFDRGAWIAGEHCVHVDARLP